MVEITSCWQATFHAEQTREDMTSAPWDNPPFTGERRRERSKTEAIETSDQASGYKMR
jgi:hypothetical protein